MTHQPVTVFTNGAGHIAIDPFPVIAHPGDTISWRSDEGKITVSFTDAPLDALQFSAERKGATKLALVNNNAPPASTTAPCPLTARRLRSTASKSSRVPSAQSTSSDLHVDRDLARRHGRADACRDHETDSQPL